MNQNVTISVRRKFQGEDFNRPDQLIRYFRDALPVVLYRADIDRDLVRVRDQATKNPSGFDDYILGVAYEIDLETDYRQRLIEYMARTHRLKMPPREAHTAIQWALAKEGFVCLDIATKQLRTVRLSVEELRGALGL
mgnify:CR=1 FL=1